jgi:hypothetical protein
MPSRARLLRAVLAVLLLGGASGCGASLSIGRPADPSAAKATGRLTSAQRAASTAQPQRPGTCQIAPPQVHFPTGGWTATETILTTNSIDACAGERLVRPVDFRRLCRAGRCRTFLFSASYYGVAVAKIVPDGRLPGYVAVFPPTTVPCPHRRGEDAGTNQDYSTITLWWSPDRQVLHGLGREHQVGRCGGGPSETYSFVATRTDPAANPPAEGP